MPRQRTIADEIAELRAEDEINLRLLGLTTTQTEIATMENPTTVTPPAATPAPAAKKAPRKTGKKAPAKQAAKPSTSNNSGKTPLKSICQKLKIEPKAARRKLRKAGLAFHAKRDRWLFTPAQAERVTELLKEAA